MKKFFNNKQKSLLVLQILLIFVLVLGTSFALVYASQRIIVSLSTADINVVYEGDSIIDTNLFIPIAEDEVTTKAASASFTVKGAETNPDIDIIYDVSLSGINITEGLISENFRYQLYRNGELFVSGDFSNIGNVTSEKTEQYQRLVLNPEVLPLPTYSDDADSYTLYLYIFDTGEFQDSMMGQTFNAHISIDTYTTKGGSTERDQYTQLVTSSKPNAPVLDDNMVPVSYDFEKSAWVKADINNLNNSWYNYDSKEWANAILLNNNEKILDISGNLNNITPTTNYTVDDSGNIVFNGTSNYLELGHANYNLNNNFTLVLNLSNLDLNGDVFGNCDNAGGFCLSYYQNYMPDAGNGGSFDVYNNVFLFKIYDSITSQYKTFMYELGGAFANNITVVFRYDGSELSIWYNGQKRTSLQADITLKASTLPFMLGASSDGTTISNYVNTNVGDIYLYETALSDTDISTYFTNQISEVPNDDSDKMLFGYNNFTASSVSNSYVNAKTGAEVIDEDVIGYFVWIPRYKYKLFNVEALAIDPIEIQVKFEQGVASTGVIDDKPKNGQWYTHPAFTFGEDELEGIWMGKFETTGTNTLPTIKPGQATLLNKTLLVLYNASKVFDGYLSGNLSLSDAHISKQIDWGAVAYLKQSRYGLGIVDIAPNNFSSSYKTGCGSLVGTAATSTTCNEYNTEIGMNASTTGNITGVYDMSGGANDAVMAFVETTAGGALTYGSSGFTNTSTATTYMPYGSKYFDLYNYGTTATDQVAYNRMILGDATGETRAWYTDRVGMIYSSNPFSIRGNPQGVIATTGIFSFYYHTGAANAAVGSRSVITLAK